MDVSSTLAAMVGASSPMVDSSSGIDEDGANPEPLGAKVVASEAHPEGSSVNNDEDDEEDDDDDGVQVTIGAINSSPAAGAGPNFNRRFSKGGGGGGAAKVATPVSAAAAAAAENGNEAVEKQKTTIDIEAEGNINGMPVKEFDLDSIIDKPWRKPGADITDYFNYGFNELTWKAYCTKQQNLRVSNGLPAIGHPNFAPEKKTSLIDTQIGRGAISGGGGGGFQKKPLVIDMAKIREKFNILGDRGGAVATQQLPQPRRMDYNRAPDPGTSSIAVIGGSDSTSRRSQISSQDPSAPLGIPTIGGAGSSISKPQPPAPFMPGFGSGSGFGDMSRPPPGFPPGFGAGPPPGVPIPSFPPQVAAAPPPPAASAPPPFGAPHNPYGADLFSAPPVAPSPFPPQSQMAPMAGPPGASVMPSSGWGAAMPPAAMPPAGPPPLGFGAPASIPAALQRSASPTVKEEEEDEDDRARRRDHSHHRESSRQRSTSPEGRHRSPSRSSKDPSSSSSSSKHRSSEKHRKRGGEEDASSRTHHKKSKKSEKDRDGHRRDEDEVKKEVE